MNNVDPYKSSDRIHNRETFLFYVPPIAKVVWKNKHSFQLYFLSKEKALLFSGNNNQLLLFDIWTNRWFLHMTVLLVQTRGKLNKKHCHMLIPSSLQRRQIFQSLITRGSLEVIAICDNRICVPPCLRSNNQSDIFFYLPPPPFPFFPGDKEIRGRVGKIE